MLVPNQKGLFSAAPFVLCLFEAEEGRGKSSFSMCLTCINYRGRPESCLIPVPQPRVFADTIPCFLFLSLTPHKTNILLP